MANPSNPNGANQYLLDPRQRKCWQAYINPNSKTFGNATQSAIAAGYEPDYADQITTVDWFKGKVRRLNMLGKAEKVLEDMLDMPVIVATHASSSVRNVADVEAEDLYNEARDAVREAGKASVSFLQRTLRIGYSRGARLVDLLEEHKVIAPADSTKPREVLPEEDELPYEPDNTDEENNEDADEQRNTVITVATDPALVRIKQDTAKFVAQTLGKNEGYSTRTEHTGPDGEPLFDDEHRKKSDKAIDDLVGSGKGDAG